MNGVSLLSSLVFITFFFSFTNNIHSSSSYVNEPPLYPTCDELFSCGNLTDVDYPFWGEDRPHECGHPKFKLKCRDDEFATIEIMKVHYRVLEINMTLNILRVARHGFEHGICTRDYGNTTIDQTLFEYMDGYTNVTILYGCPPFSSPGYNLPLCYTNTAVEVVIGSRGPVACNTSVTMLVPDSKIEWLKRTKFSGLDNVIRNDGFEVKWKADTECDECRRKEWRCGYNSILNHTTCNTPLSSTSPARKSSKTKVALIIGILLGGAAIVCIALALWFFGIRQRKKKLLAESKSKGLSTPSSSNGVPTPTTKFSRTTASYPSSLSTDLEKGGFYFGVQVFTYEELEEATDNFDPSRELGDGGFGVVFKGNLQDGREVAVKRLYENNFKRVHQFINEVEILARLRHPNLVSLYGCTSRRSQELLLVYEYIPNGTIADHLHGNSVNSGLLTWPVRLRIAIESAGALTYLHKSDIIHRDVKTNNILLDNDFRVKVADFGLSRLFPPDVTHVSTAPQGTPGYVDPEYYQCYQLTAKSDVYSFGVVLVELITSLPAVDINRHRHDINLSNMAISKIQNHMLHELVDPSLGFETDCSVRRMTTLVAELAFRCLQQDRDRRPSMEEVFECLRVIEMDQVKKVKPEVVDLHSDDVGLLKSMPPPISPDFDKWGVNLVGGANSY